MLVEPDRDRKRVIEPMHDSFRNNKSTLIIVAHFRRAHVYDLGELLMNLIDSNPFLTVQAEAVLATHHGE